MTTVMLVGERQTILRILGEVLAREGISIQVASTRSDLELLLTAELPDVIVFDHVGPIDLYNLNPRELGFYGPMVLISETDENETAQRLLQTDHLVRGHVPTEIILSVRTLVGAGQ